jgi:hypothetical protein
MSGGLRVWESDVEFEPTLVYTLLLGGPHAPGIDDALKGNNPASSAFNPSLWNNYSLILVHPNGKESSSTLSTFKYPRIP